MNWPTLVLIFLVHSASCRISGAFNEEDFYSKTECCCPKNTSRELDCNTKLAGECKPASWELLNTTNGRFKMSFDFLQGCAVAEYTAFLFLNENITDPQQCATFSSSKKNWSKHTYHKTLKVTDWKAGCTECDKTGEFYFQFMFTGCYFLKITAHRTSINLCPRFLESNYKKQLLDRKIEVKPQSNPMSLQIDMHENPWKQMLLINTTLHFTLKNNTDLEVKKWKLELQPDLRVKCYPEDQQECKMDSSGILKISLPGMQPGNYSYKMRINGAKDNRCSLNTLWNNQCVWSYKQMVTRKPKIITDYDEQDTPLYLPVYGPVLAGIFVVLTLTLIATRYAMKRRPLTVPVQVPTALSIVGERPAILLLYSRDCGPFMKLMESFRRLLEKATELEIYDCNDPKRWSEVSRDPSAWMQRLTTMRDIRVVAVASQCASLRQRAHLDGRVFHFVKPLNTDKLFAYGLQLLSDSLNQSATYLKAFVVRFDGVSNDSDLFVAMNPYTRFVLPSHLDKLVSSLKLGATDKPDESWIAGEEGKALLDNLQDFVQYKQENTDYLQKLLVIEENPITSLEFH